MPCLLPSGVLASPGKPGANDRLTVAPIGVGGMGGVDLSNLKVFREQGSVNIAAVSDVDEERLALAVQKAGAGVPPYRDYRYILERKDVDAVVIATPDHWHAVQTVQACETGKHVYVEKPSSVTVTEGRAMITAARNRATSILEHDGRTWNRWRVDGRLLRLKPQRLNVKAKPVKTHLIRWLPKFWELCLGSAPLAGLVFVHLMRLAGIR